MELPTRPQLIAAVRMWGPLCTEDHPLLALAQDLMLQHTYRTTTTNPLALCQISEQRKAVIREIDAWVHQAVPMVRQARLHTETIGAIIDRLAWISSLIDTSPGSGHPCELEYLWNSLDELLLGYEHLSEDVLSGVRRLPGTSTQPGVFTSGT
ncbi:DUF4254 domain-containing protein [Nocardia sp. NPDC058499]|uniref:DUF4254 domain-containing protein n=1 Tax=Nocardia sp. NPDC058499 TaxID=3346530 RepID=UPI00364DC6CE